MFARLLAAVASLLPPPRVIKDRDSAAPYLLRWYLLGRRRGESSDGTSRDVWPGFNLFLHKFCRSDDAGELHSHPWKWSLALILVGGYSEERRCSDDSVVRRVLLPLSFNGIRQDDYHRVDLLGRECWTLFLAGPKVSTWYFWNRDSKVRTGWRRFCKLPGFENEVRFRDSRTDRKVTVVEGEP